MECALTIAGSDPTGGAGIQSDLQVFRALAVYGTSVIAALTAQNTQGVTETFAVDEQLIRAQLGTLLSDIKPSALKTGMLYSEGAVRAVADAVREHGLKNLVIDPVAVSSSGSRLLLPEAEKTLREELLPLARVVTPNMAEAAWLAGMQVETPGEMERAARAIADLGPEMVVVTGGHLLEKAEDIVFDGKQIYRLEGEMHEGAYHGTGCAYSACITALLALGSAPVEAARRAKELVAHAIAGAVSPGGGMKILRFESNNGKS